MRPKLPGSRGKNTPGKTVKLEIPGGVMNIVAKAIDAGLAKTEEEALQFLLLRGAQAVVSTSSGRVCL